MISLNSQASVRLSSRKGFVLTDGDVEILKYVLDYRLTTIEHLCALTSRKYVPIHRRVLKMTQHGYLYRIVRPMEKHIFALGKAGITVLVQGGVAPPELLDWRARTNELSPFFVQHELMVVDLHCMLELATRESEIRLVRWAEGPSLFDRVVVSENGARRKLPVRPDALFVLEDSRRPAGQNTAHFFLEADRSTTAHSRYGQKALGYWHYFQQGRHTKKFGIKRFRVVTITLTQERALNLSETTAKVLAAGAAHQMFLFASIEMFSLQNAGPILGDVFLRPQDFGAGIRYRLIPPVKPAELVQHDTGEQSNQKGGTSYDQ